MILYVLRLNFNTREVNTRDKNQSLPHNSFPRRLIGMAAIGFVSPKRPGAFYSLKT